MKLFIKVLLITILYELNVKAREGHSNSLIFFIRGQKSLSNYWNNNANKSSEDAKIIFQNNEINNDITNNNVEKKNPLIIYLPGKKDEVYSKINFSLTDYSKLNDLSGFQRFISEIKLVAPSAEELISKGYDCSNIGLSCSDLKNYDFTINADEWLSKVDLKLFIESDILNNIENIEEQEKELFQYEIKNNYKLGNVWNKFISNIDKNEINVENIAYPDFVFRNYGSMPVYVYVGDTIFLKRDLNAESKNINDSILEKTQMLRLKLDTMGNRIIDKNIKKLASKIQMDENISFNNVIRNDVSYSCQIFFDLYPDTLCEVNSDGEIVYLDIVNNTLSYDQLDYIFGIKTLESLVLNSDNIITIPPSIGNLVNLQEIHFRNNLIEEIPEEIGKLTKLKVLDFYTNNLSVTIPSFIENLKELITLDLGFNFLNGEIPEFIGKLENLSYLYLDNNFLSGPIPDSFENLTNLEELFLGNNDLSGTFPSFIGNFTKLKLFYLYRTQITGPIPDTIGNLTELTQLILFENQLSGQIPKTIGNLTNLVLLYLDTNKFSGEIPTEEFEKLTNLTQISLSDNEELYGQAPDKNKNYDFCTFFNTLLCYNKRTRNNKCDYPEIYMNCETCKENSSLLKNVCQCNEGYSGIGYIECKIDDIADTNLSNENENNENNENDNNKENENENNENADKTNENTDNTDKTNENKDNDKSNENKDDSKTSDNKDNKENDSSSSSKIKLINTLNLLLVFVVLVLLKN